MTVSVKRYDLVKIKPTESEAKIIGVAKRYFWYQTVIEERENKHCDWLVLPRKSRKKWKRSDSYDSDSFKLMTPLTTPILIDFTRP